MTNTIDIILWIWFALTAISVAYVAYDLFTSTPEMKVMKWGWILVTLYTGIVGLVIYWFSCREPAPGTHEKFIAPLWKQSVGSTIHCMAGDATGIIVAAAITSLLGLPMGVDAVIEYFAGFAFGLFIFQALFMKDMLGGSYWQAVKSTVLPEWLSMNAVMAGMIPTMIILMTRDMRAMEPWSVRFWGIMSLATLIGAVLAYPVNLWLVAKKLKHGMGTERALGKGGAKTETDRSEKANQAETISAAGHDMLAMPEMSKTAMTGMKMDKSEIAGMQTAAKDSIGRDASSTAIVAAPHDMTAMGGKKMDGMNMGGNVPISSKLIVTLITLLMLAGGGFLAASYGDLSMRAI
ncbi:MAG: DUF4396 domain-containing protein [Acidobacteriota bacterium]|nr:DUF4396 domain-containing protein [Acidobacteriota bacterium]